MKTFCIPPALADRLKTAAIAGEINIAQMYEMSSEQRRGLFEKYVDAETAKQINIGFEKAMTSSQKTALKKWAENTFNSKAKKTTQYKDVLDKINELDDMGLLTPEKADAFLEDLVSSKLGVGVSADEAKIIHEKAQKLESLAGDRSEFGTPTAEYFKAKRDMENYLDSITPTSRLKIATSTIGRGTMLLSIKSPLLNIVSNSVQGLLQAAERRFSTKNTKAFNNDYALNYTKFVNKVYQESGYDISRMVSLKSDRTTLGEDIFTSQGEGKVRKIGRFYEDVVFKQLMGAPDVAFSALHFADSANLGSSKMALAEGLSGDKAKARAQQIFQDATSIEPKTLEGQAIRAQAIADAEYSTYTNKSKYADLALGIRRLFNIPSKDLRLGDQIMPFVKTPANVIGAGIDSSGILVPVDVAIKMANTIKAVKNGESWTTASAENMRGLTRTFVRAGLGLTFAFALSSIFKPEDFIGEYPVSEKERQLLDLKNATTNSVRIGDKWYSLDYFGPIGAPLVGMLYAKKYGKDLPSAAQKYYEGVGRQAVKIPGFTEFYNTIQGLKEARPEKDKPVQEIVGKTAGNAVDFIRARVIPALVYDIAKSSDQFERKTDPNKPLDKLKNAIPAGTPGLPDRGDLPVKKTVFGEEKKTEGWLTLFAGARIKTSKSDATIDELDRLATTGNLPSITDVSKTSERAKKLKEQIGDEKFNEAMDFYGTTFKDRLDKLTANSMYKELPDEKKQKKINDLKDKTFKLMLIQYNYDPTK